MPVAYLEIRRYNVPGAARTGVSLGACFQEGLPDAMRLDISQAMDHLHNGHAIALAVRRRHWIQHDRQEDDFQKFSDTGFALVAGNGSHVLYVITTGHSPTAAVVKDQIMPAMSGKLRDRTGKPDDVVHHLSEDLQTIAAAHADGLPVEYVAVVRVSDGSVLAAFGGERAQLHAPKVEQLATSEALWRSVVSGNETRIDLTLGSDGEGGGGADGSPSKLRILCDGADGLAYLAITRSDYPSNHVFQTVLPDMRSRYKSVCTTLLSSDSTAVRTLLLPVMYASPDNAMGTLKLAVAPFHRSKTKEPCTCARLTQKLGACCIPFRQSLVILLCFPFYVYLRYRNRRSVRRILRRKRQRRSRQHRDIEDPQFLDTRVELEGADALQDQAMMF